MAEIPKGISVDARRKMLPPIKPVPTDYSNLHISRDEFIAKRKKLREYEARLDAYSEQAKQEVYGEKVEKRQEGLQVETRTEVPQEPPVIKPDLYVPKRGRPRKQI